MRKRTRRQTLMLEPLEDRVLLAGNLLITSEIPGTIAYDLMEYTQQGVRLSSQPVPQAPGSTEYKDARGLSVDPSGNVNIFDGTFSPSLATLSPTTGNWSFQTTPGWSTVNNISYGEVAAYKDFVFASDMGTYGGEANGIVRFDSSGGLPVRFAPGNDFIQVALGRDGLLYGLGGSGDVHVFDPDTLGAVRTFTLKGGPDYDIRSIAVDASGQVLAATWGGFAAKYDANGTFLASTQLKNASGYGENLMNIALDSDGQIAVGGRDGDIFLTDESLAPATRIATNQWDVFVTFNHYIGSVPRPATPSFSSLAGPTITYGQPSVTLGGTISSGSGYPTGNVNISVNGVTQSAAINSTDGSFSAVFDTSNLGASSSPYTITYSYGGDSNDTAIQDTSKALTVNQAMTTLGSLSAPIVPVGTTSVTLSGVVGSNSPVLPVGQSVTVTVSGTSGSVANGSGTIGADGSFFTNLDISALSVGPYTITYSYGGDSNFTAVQDTSKSLTVSASTPSFSSLAGPTITYGQPSVTLGGIISSGSGYPTGNVNISVNGVTQSAAISSTDGSFSAVFDTSNLGASSSPYTITYSYGGDSNDTAIQDTSKALTVNQAMTTLGSLSAPIVVIGTSTATLSGVVGSNSVLPAGQTIIVTVNGTKLSGTIGTDGHFSVSFNTSALTVGSYAIQYAYAGDANFKASQGTGTLNVTYAIKTLYNTTTPVHSGDTLDVKIQVTNASGHDLSSAKLTVTAVMLVDGNGNTFTPHAKGGDYSGNKFRNVKGGYEYKLSTAGLAAGKYNLLVRVGNDPLLHALPFVVG